MKKIVSFILIIAMVVSLMAGLGLSSDAATAHSQAEAVSWANSKIGIKTGDGQCVALIKAYYTYLGVSSVTGNGCDYATNSLPSGWKRIKYYSGFSAQPGDIAVWTWNKWAGNYGHVAIVTSANSSSMNYIDQGKTYGYVGHSGSLAYSEANWTFYGVIRPNFSGTGASVENLGNDFYAFIIKKNTWLHLSAENGNVKISSTGNDSSDPKQIWHFLRQSNGTYKIVNEYNSNCLEAVNFGNTAGTNIATYTDNGTTAQRWFIYKNGNGYNLSPSYSNLVMDANGGSDAAGTNIQLWPVNNADSQRYSIYKLTEDGVNYVKPSAPTVYKPSVSVTNKTVKISWNKSPLNGKYDKRVYDIRIYKGSTSSEAIYSKFDITGTELTYTAGSTGTYYVTLAAVNTKYYSSYKISEAVKFTVTENTACSHSYSAQITRQATCVQDGIKTFTCTKCGNQYTQSISATGHNYSGVVTKQATCTQAGIKTFTCSKCGGHYTEEIAATGHNWEKEVFPASIEFENAWDGYCEMTCTNCSATSRTTIAAIKNVALSGTNFVYSGSVITPSVKVTDKNGKLLTKGTDYTVSYQSGRKAIGAYKVTISFKGNYEGRVTKSFKIVPKGTSLSTLTAGKKALAAKWKKLGGITGYQIQYSTKSNFSGAKLVTIRSTSTLSKTIKSLSAKKVYYVRVRTYKTVSGMNFMSNWSKTYKVKTK